MKKRLTLLIALMSALSLSAQYNVSTAPEQSQVVKTSIDSTQAVASNLKIEYESAAKKKAEHLALIKERNYFEIGGHFQTLLNAYNNNWTTVRGGENNVNLSLQFLCRHTYKKNRFSMDSKAEAAYGQTYQQSDKWFKHQDYFKITTNPAWAMATQGVGRFWSYTVDAQLYSQFDKGYKDRAAMKSGQLKSNFFSPATLNVSVGVKYTSPNPKYPFKINILPLSCQAVFVKDGQLRKYTFDSLSNKTTSSTNPYGMPMKHDYTSRNGINYFAPCRFEGGSSIGIDLDVYLDHKKHVRYRTSMYSFYGWISDIAATKSDGYQHIVPTFNWDNTFDISFVKYLAFQFQFSMFYDHKQMDALQLRYFTSIGLSYTFKNK